MATMESDAIRFVRHTKRKYDILDLPPYKRYQGPIRQLRKGEHDQTQEGFLKLLNFIEYDLGIIYFVIQRDPANFFPFIRSHNIAGVDAIMKDLCDDIYTMYAKRFDMCPYDHLCKYKECCRYIHVSDIQYLSKTFTKLQEATNRYINHKIIENGSHVIKHLEYLRNATWNILARRVTPIH